MAKKQDIKGADLIAERARVLNEQIATLEAQIKKLDSQLQSSPGKPKLRSTAIPHGTTISRKTEPLSPPPKSAEPVFEEIKVPPRSENEASDMFNEMGVRKYDLPAFWSRLRGLFSAPTAGNPRLVNYLAAGGVQGLRPLRYEKRIARNRFIAFAIVLFALLLGFLFIYLHNH